MGTFVGQCQQRHPGCDAHASVISAGGSPHFCTIAASVSKRISYDGSPACVAGRAAGLAVVVSLKWSALVARVVARETEGGREVCWRGGVGRERVGDAHVGDLAWCIELDRPSARRCCAAGLAAYASAMPLSVSAFSLSREAV